MLGNSSPAMLWGCIAIKIDAKVSVLDVNEHLHPPLYATEGHMEYYLFQKSLRFWALEKNLGAAKFWRWKQILGAENILGAGKILGAGNIVGGVDRDSCLLPRKATLSYLSKCYIWNTTHYQ